MSSVPDASRLRRFGLKKRMSTSLPGLVLASEVLRDAVEDAVDEGPALLGAEGLRELDGFVQNDRPWDVVAVEELPSAKAQHVAIYARHTFQPPMHRGLCDLGVRALLSQRCRGRRRPHTLALRGRGRTRAKRTQ